MTAWDDKQQLINYVRYVFITSDTSGLSEETVMAPTVVPKPGAPLLPVRSHGSSSLDVDDYNPSSPDIEIETAHRRRSSTSKRLESLKKHRITHRLTRSVLWKFPDTESERTAVPQTADPFPKADIIQRPRYIHSKASELISSAEHTAINPFHKYLKYDASDSVGMAVKTVDVFLPMLQDATLKAQPLRVTVYPHAKVSHFVGLVCFHYTARQLQPQLSADVDGFDLCVAEESGDVDNDLPPRSPDEPMSKFHFPYMALYSDRQIVQVNSSYTTLQDVKATVLERHFERSAVPSYKQFDYVIEKLNEPGKILNPETTILSLDTTDFYCYRINSKRLALDLSAESVFQGVAGADRSKEEQHFEVTVLKHLKRSYRASLYISETSLRICSSLQREPFFLLPLFLQRRRTLSTDKEKLIPTTNLVSCHAAGRNDSIVVVKYVNRRNQERRCRFSVPEGDAQKIVGAIMKVFRRRNRATL